jgi:hypothetical protein
MMGSEPEMQAHRLGILKILELRGGLHGLPDVLLDSLLPSAVPHPPPIPPLAVS